MRLAQSKMLDGSQGQGTPVAPLQGRRFQQSDVKSSHDALLMMKVTVGTIPVRIFTRPVNFIGLGPRRLTGLGCLVRLLSQILGHFVLYCKCTTVLVYEEEEQQKEKLRHGVQHCAKARDDRRRVDNELPKISHLLFI
jgi:hypothetical protein